MKDDIQILALQYEMQMQNGYKRIFKWQRKLVKCKWIYDGKENYKPRYQRDSRT